MSDDTPDKSPAVAVGVVPCRIRQGYDAAQGLLSADEIEILLCRRGKAPRKGEWSLVGGRLEWGESCGAAALRECREETGIDLAMGGFLGLVDGIFSGADGVITHHYVLLDYWAYPISGLQAKPDDVAPRAADDAADAGWFGLDAALAQLSWQESQTMVQKAVAAFLAHVETAYAAGKEQDHAYF